MHTTIKLILISCFLILTSCGNEDVLPKPSASLALQYPDATYGTTTTDYCPFVFELNEYARVLSKNDCSMKIEYPYMDATVYLTYNKVDDNLTQLLIDGQKLSYKHNIKADVIKDYPFMNEKSKVYGMMYEVEGNAASNAQFYVTDSTNHFLTASLYFDTRPNYDSILPAVDYVKKDMINLLETLQWK
ncbi:gliding motility lipoprotein GldD [Nonlabens tegetincola]|uniref:gliding motility lipoprotein GldD n=1 Tax=Nonlabens tegetincola TaxID=323273 RepID=UPI0005AB41DF|nr:gliding motility lipoprotein GldD [Nonlabens tegetincola]